MVSKLARDAVKARLEAAWETKLLAVAGGNYPSVGTDDRNKLAAINWGATGKRQVFQGQINIDQLEASTAVSWPLVIIFATDLSHDGEEKFSTFSGSVAVNVELHYTWRKSAALPNFDDYMDLIEETFIGVFHDRTWIGALDAGLSYRGELTAQRGQVQESGENWSQAISFRMIFGVDV